ncbi:MAG: superinfection immunity protein [Chloroflexi bacterium]|nr:superinfection immunity protein [Chloroflexota bacterium]
MEGIVALVIFLGLLGLYFLPSIVALNRGAKNPFPTIIINFFFGWTFVGWVVALAMGAGARTRDDFFAGTRPRTGDYIVCPQCSLENWTGYKECQKCGSSLW